MFSVQGALGSIPDQGTRSHMQQLGTGIDRTGNLDRKRSQKTVEEIAFETGSWRVSKHIWKSEDQRISWKFQKKNTMYPSGKYEKIFLKIVNHFKTPFIFAVFWGK